MELVPALPPPIRRTGRAVLGPPLPRPAALWRGGGRRGVTAALCAMLPLAIGIALDQPGLGAAGALGAFTAIYGHALPYRRRAVVLAGVALGMTLSAWLGALTGHHSGTLSFVVGALAAAGTAGTAVWRIGPPGAVGFVIVGGGSSALGTTPGEHLLAAGAAAALAWGGCMVPWLWDRTGPERRAVENAERAVAAMTAAGPGAAVPGTVASDVRLADAALQQAGPRGRDELRARLRTLEERFLRALPAAHETFPAPASAGRPVAERAPAWAVTATRTGLGVTAAGLAAAALGLSNPYWAATTAAAVLAGTDPRQTRARGLHRAVGTVLGVLLAGAIISADLPAAAGIAVVGLLQLAIELFVAHRYWLAVSFITPLVLTLVHIAVPARPGGDLVLERLTETGLGIAVALVIGSTLFRREGSRRLPGAVAVAREATVTAAVQPAGDDVERRLHDALLALGQVAAASRAELVPDAHAAADLERARHVADLGWALLGARARGERALEEGLARRITAELGTG